MEMHEQVPLEGGGLPDIPRNVVSKFASQSQLEFELEFYGRILDLGPNYVDVLRVMGNNLTAKGDYRRGLEMDLRLAKLMPEDPIARYNLACTLSLLGEVDRAFEALQEAITLGYDEFDYMQEDRDLAAIRKDPRFRKLLRSHGIR